jgi:hypothetical protein
VRVWIRGAGHHLKRQVEQGDLDLGGQVFHREEVVGDGEVFGEVGAEQAIVFARRESQDGALFVV